MCAKKTNLLQTETPVVTESAAALRVRPQILSSPTGTVPVMTGWKEVILATSTLCTNQS